MVVITKYSSWRLADKWIQICCYTRMHCEYLYREQYGRYIVNNGRGFSPTSLLANVQRKTGDGKLKEEKEIRYLCYDARKHHGEEGQNI